MKNYIYILIFTAAISGRAGMPDVEMPEALIDKIEKTPAGWVATVTGAITVPVVDPSKPDEGLLTTLYADKARVMVRTGNQLYALSLSGSDRYEKRLKAMIGKKVNFVQMWGATITLEAGRVVQIIAGDVSLLRPQKGEAAFDISRLPEIGAK